MDLRGKVYLGKISVPRNWSSVCLHPGVALDDWVVLLVSDSNNQIKISIGSNTYINRSTFVDSSLSIVVGSDCMIGPGCYITDHDHSISPPNPPGNGPLVGSPTVIEDRVWIGANCVILKGVTVGANSVIAASSVVTKDVPPFSIFAGVPATFLKHARTM